MQTVPGHRSAALLRRDVSLRLISGCPQWASNPDELSNFPALTKRPPPRTIGKSFSPEAEALPTLIATEFEDLQLYARGKVRDLYAVGDLLLLVATDRISAFDHVLGSGIPGKGRVLTQLSLFWFDLLRDIVPNHLVTANVKEFPSSLRPYAEELEGRSMLVNRARMF